MAAPFLKWAGGKAKLAPRVASMAPKGLTAYHEPFVGGGAVFFALSARQRGLRRARLADANGELIGCYSVVKEQPLELVAALAALADQYLGRDPDGRKAMYYAIRASEAEGAVARAARLIFLNRTGYNGLYRVNSGGGFNVPHGRYTKPRICDREGILAASEALQVAAMAAEDFEAACERARPGDFVYLDPPYQPLSATARFTTYTSADFGPAEQARLRDAFERLTARGVAAVLSNSDHSFIHDLYGRRGYTLEAVEMSRAINSKGNRRAPVPELLIDNLTRVGVKRPPGVNAALDGDAAGLQRRLPSFRLPRSGTR